MKNAWLLHEVPQRGKTPEHQGLSRQLRFCGEQGTPCCAIILYEKVPSFVGWIVTLRHRIWWIRSAGIIQSIHYYSLLSLYVINICRILPVISRNLAVHRHVRTADRTRIWTRN